MNLSQINAYLNQTTQIGSIYGLNQIFLLLNEINNPQDHLNVIHVAGTNGKGSVCNILSSILNHASFKIGLFNSPYILTYTETIQINGVSISEDVFIRSATRVIQAREKLISSHGISATNFECLTAIALDVFVQENVDIAIIEVGLGGLLDATNVFKHPLLTIITSIDYDHTGLLGSTLEEIASAKAGIIRPNIAVVCAPNEDKVVSVIKEQADLHQSLFLYVDPEKTFSLVHAMTLQKMIFSIQTPSFHYRQLVTPLIGTHQLENISVALTALDLLTKHQQLPILPSHVQQGLANTQWPCRCEYITEPFPLLMDGAHNVEGIQSLVQVLERTIFPQKITLLFGILKDKNISEILFLLSKISSTIILTLPSSERALPLDELYPIANQYFEHVYQDENMITALEMAVAHAKETNTFLCCAGSFYLSIPLRNYVVNGDSSSN